MPKRHIEIFNVRKEIWTWSISKATINRATFYIHYADKYALLEEITELVFLEMIPEQVLNAREFTMEVCDQLILLTHRYIVDFYRVCRMDSKSNCSASGRKGKENVAANHRKHFSKGLSSDNRRTKIISAMTGAAIYGAAHDWLTVGENNRTDILIDLVRPYVMNGLGLYSHRDPLINNSPAAPIG
ncbi:TetR/AcrR family transcriptional regulator [Cohnella sp. GCM10012308]|uniref:TetR/AcrR family transcriptional regulator n=1 Tax=Cohnella sp. GCM10012308 TaxID=3317329 RepID=UPI003613C069